MTASCLDCPATFPTDAAAARHTRDTQHATTTGLVVTGPVCDCGHRSLVHAYRPGSGNDGRCLARECGCRGRGQREGVA